MVMSNLTEVFNQSMIAVNTTLPAVYVVDPYAQLSVILLTIIAFCEVVELVIKLGNWLLSDSGDY